MKKVIIGVLLIVVFAAIGFFGFVPRIIDNVFNPVTPHEPYFVSERARDIHARAFVADAHADPLLWERDLLKRNNKGMVDIPRLLEGNVAIQVFGSVTKTPKGQNYEANSGDSDNITALAIVGLWPVKTWGSLFERALYHAEKLSIFEAQSKGALRIVGTASELDAVMEKRLQGTQIVAAFMGLEGAHALEGRVENLDRLYDAGYRMLGLAHFFDNEVAGSMHGEEKYGLTDLGRQVVRRAEELGVIIDVAHSSQATVDDVLKWARRPVIYSHGGVQGVCNVNRNLTDAHIRKIADMGGLIALGAWDAAACGDTPAHLARAIRYIRDLVGVDYAAIGSDFDGAVQTSFDASEYAALTQALMDEGFDEDDIGKVLGGNALAFYRKMLPQ